METLGFVIDRISHSRSCDRKMQEGMITFRRTELHEPTHVS
jgi:hypothetical protein